MPYTLLPDDTTDPNGFAIDRSRPKLPNPDGSYSTERTITVESGGRHYLLPTIVDGKRLSDSDAIAAWRSGANNPVGEYASAKAADQAAVARSAAIGGGGFRLLPDEPSDASQVARGTGLGVRALATGVSALPTMIGDAANTAINYGIRGVNALGGNVPELGMPSQAVQRGMTAVGLPTPDTAGERVASDVLGAATGAGGMAKAFAALAAKMGPGTPQAVLQALGLSPGMQTVSGAAGGAAGGITREAGGGPGAQLAASLAGAFAPSAVQAAGSAAVRGTIRGGEQGRQVYADRLQTFEDVGTTPSVGQASGNRAMQQVESGLSNVSSSAGVMDRAAVREAKEIGARVDELANNLLPNPSATKAGLTIEKGLKNFVDRFRSEQDFLYSKLDQFIPPGTMVPANNALQKIQSLTAPIQGAEKTSSLIQTPKMGAIGEALVEDTAATGAIPYEALKKLRTAIGEKITNPSLTDDIPTGQWKQIYGALSDDMAAAAQAAGPDAVKAFNRANAFTRAGHERIDSILNRVSGKDTAEKIFQAAINPSEIREGGTTIRTVMKSLDPAERNAVTAATIKRMGLATPGQQNELGEQFSSQTFLTNWNKVSPEAKASLFPDGDLRRDLDQIAKAANMIREGSKVFANPSGTSPAISNQVTGFTLAGSAITGRFDVMASIATLLAGANISARLMTNPNFVKWLAKSTTMPPAMIPTQLQMLSNYAAKNWPEEDRADLSRYLESVNAGAGTQ